MSNSKSIAPPPSDTVAEFDKLKCESIVKYWYLRYPNFLL